MEDFRERTANDRAAALDAKYDPDDEIAMRRLGAPVEASAFLKILQRILKVVQLWVVQKLWEGRSNEN